jgi:hypothetical protein
VYVMGWVGEVMLRGGQFTKETYSLVNTVINGAASLSNRVRCYHKPMSGVASKHPAKVIWDKMKMVAKDVEHTVGFNISDAQLCKWKEQLQTAEAGSLADVANALCVIVEGEDTALLTQLAKYSLVHTPKDDPEDLLRHSDEISLSVARLLKRLVVENSYMEPVLNDHTDANIVQNSLSETAGAGEMVQKVHDALFWDEPDNLPDGVMFMQVVAMTASFLQLFNTGLSQVLAEVARRSTLHVEFFKALNTDVTPSHTASSKFRALAELYRTDIWNSGGKRQQVLDESSPYFTLQTLVQKMEDTPRFSKHLYSIVHSTVAAGGPDAVDISRHCTILQTSIPREIEPLNRAAKAFNRMNDYSERLHAGKAVPHLVEMAEALEEFEHAKGPFEAAIATRPDLQADSKKISDECKGALANFSQKVKRWRAACALIEKRSEGLLEAVETGGGLGAYKFLYKGRNEPDVEIKTAMKQVEQYVSQYTNSKDTANKLALSVKCLPEEFVTTVKNLKDGFDANYRTELDAATRLAAHIVILNTVLSSGLEESKWPGLSAKALAYVKTDLQFGLDGLAEPLLRKISGATKAPKATKAAIKIDDDAPHPTASSSSSVGPASVANAAFSKPASKRLRTFCGKES